MSYGTPISPNQPSFGIPGQTKVSGDHQRETTHEICCLAAELADEERTFVYFFYYLSVTPLCKLLALGPTNEQLDQKMSERLFRKC